MGAVPIAVIVVITLALVLGLGLLIFSLMRRSQEAVPRIAGQEAARTDRVVAVDEQGRPITESEAGDEPAPRDDAGFDAALKEELKDLGR
jgi:non-ribosomal peptide synthetase component E (peptide arylation enzyme)